MLNPVTLDVKRPLIHPLMVNGIMVGKVLRIQKVPNDRPECENSHSALLHHESLLWGKFEGMVSAPTREIVEHAYVQKVMCPLLGSEHVDAGV
ncbi:hypothetical protein SASPL_102953 [Salvia splendens]|uniref:Inositol-pentakisphosphate 2-kinase n=1 Tax=Salvia splendens TaxID=180675 RepID=A0A8X8YXN0_SALSN|nr:hypothetical protein SASPL_102953 [Salvia splendens]